MTYLEEIKQKEIKIHECLKMINRLTQAFIEDEFSLNDLVSAEEHFDDSLNELKTLIEDVIHLRQLLGLEELDIF